jgi:hypothetical protein
VARVAITLALALLAAGCGGSAPPRPDVGAVDDAVRSDPSGLLDQLTDSGLRAVGATSIWEPGRTAPSAAEAAALAAVVAGAAKRDVRVFLAVYPRGSRTTPVTPPARAEFAAYIGALVRSLPALDDVIIGNEPNLNRFWLPQFGPNGEDVAAPAYLALLAQAYDAAKSARPDVRVWGGATAPRGIDRPGTGRDTHSPTTFIRDLGAAYRASGRTAPVMDGFVHHPYADSSSAPLDLPHPRTTTIGLADYDKLVGLLAEAFDGTGQPGSDLPILYGEIGVETIVPAGREHLYTGRETGQPVSEASQARAYERVLQVAACQPTVDAVLLFHLRDEPALEGWQSGVRLVDGKPKQSDDAVHDAVTDPSTCS